MNFRGLEAMKLLALAIGIVTSAGGSADPLQVDTKPSDYNLPFVSYGQYLEVRNGAGDICSKAYDGGVPGQSEAVVNREVKQREWTENQKALLRAFCMFYLEGKLVAIGERG